MDKIDKKKLLELRTFFEQKKIFEIGRDQLQVSIRNTYFYGNVTLNLFQFHWKEKYMNVGYEVIFCRVFGHDEQKAGNMFIDTDKKIRPYLSRLFNTSFIKKII